MREWLEWGELDAVVVGAVELAGDVRSMLARNPVPAAGAVPRSSTSPVEPKGCRQSPAASDGAVCLVLKRLADAQRDDDRIYAVFRGGDSGSQRLENVLRDDCEPLAPIGYFDVQWADQTQARKQAAEISALAANGSGGVMRASCAVGSILGDLGWVGAATGLAAVAKAAICLDQQILPAPRTPLEPLEAIATRASGFFIPGGAQFWLRNRASGPRRACVALSSLGGNSQYVVLDEYEPRKVSGTESSVEVPAVGRSQPLGARRLGLFVIEAEDERGLFEQIDALAAFSRVSPTRQVDLLARSWWQHRPNDPGRRHGIAIVADGLDSLERNLRLAERRIREELPEEHRVLESSRVYFRPSPTLDPKRVAFVYPGLGNQSAGMCRAISALWPDVLRAQDERTAYLRDQFDPGVWWSAKPPAPFDDHRTAILGSVSASSLMTDVLRHFGVRPAAAIGYSLGETAALIALGAWTDRDGLKDRLWSSPLFHTELAGTCSAARRLWRIPPGEPVDWVAGIVPLSLEAVLSAIRGKRRVYPLIKNAADETVIGGRRRDAEDIVASLGCPFSEIPTVSTVHCELGTSALADYRALHDLETAAPPGITFYSGIWGRSYQVDRRSAADAIAAQASRMVDFPAVIEQAYEDGLRIFLEVGPGSSCTRLIGRILFRRPHLACSAAPIDGDPLGAVLELLGHCIAERVPVDLGPLYRGPASGGPEDTSALPDHDRTVRRTIRIDVRGQPFQVPALPSSRVGIIAGTDPDDYGGRTEVVSSGSTTSGSLAQVFLDAERATARAHRAYLSATQNSLDLIGMQLAHQLELIEQWSRQSALASAAWAPRVMEHPRESFGMSLRIPLHWTDRHASSLLWERSPRCSVRSLRSSTAFPRGSGCRTSP